MKKTDNIKVTPELIQYVILFCSTLFSALYSKDSALHRRKDGAFSIKTKAWKEACRRSRLDSIPDSKIFQEYLRQHGITLSSSDNSVAFWGHSLCTEQVMATLVADRWLTHRPYVRYVLWKNIRRQYGLKFDPDTVSMIHLICDALNNLIGDSQCIVPLSSTRSMLNEIAEHRIVDGFMEMCLIIQVIKPHYGHPDRIHIERLDAEFLLSNCFGMPSSIPGFDQLFGGGGIILGETDATGKVITKGRLIFIKGGFGAGKTSLALSLASEIAKKGGLVWYYPLEQNASDCQMCISTLNLTRDSDVPVEIIDNIMDYDFAESSPKFGKIFISQMEKQHAEHVLADLENTVPSAISELRAFVIDSFNCILDLQTIPREKLRGIMVSRLREILDTGANVIVAGETELFGQENTNFVQNIADVVVSLEVQHSAEGYSQRYFKIEKSRAQREQRGAHSFSIKSGLGFDIYPSSAAMAARMRSRRLTGGSGSAKFGWGALDDILGEKAIQPGDVVSIEGDSGCFKTHLGLIFAMGQDDKLLGRGNDIPNTLILALGDRKNTINRMATSHAQWLRDCEKKARQLITKEGLSVGFIQPGKVFQLIDEAFDGCVGGNYIDRVWIDNVWRWDWLCPFIRADRTFGLTLVDYFRKRKVTSLFTCRGVESESGGLQRGISDLANVRIRIERIEHRGRMVCLLRVYKSRGMHHSVENHILEFEGDSLKLSESGNMLRLEHGVVRAIPTRLFLHAETNEQTAYNEHIASSMKPLMGGKIEAVTDDRTLANATQILAGLATVDELQIEQRDEFQCSKEYAGIPYFTNIGLFVWNPNLIDVSVLNSWAKMAEYARNWTGEQAFFELESPSNETIVCLWLEIFWELVREATGDADPVRCIQMLGADSKDERKLIEESCVTFRDLCKFGYSTESRIRGNKEVGPAVSRKWFTCLGEFLRRQRTHGREYEIAPLPTCCSVSGDWVLSVPSYSAAKSCAGAVIAFLTSIEQQVVRLSRGVGLPVSEELLAGSGLLVTQEMALSRKMVNTTKRQALRRSMIPRYRDVSEQWALCLRNLLEDRGNLELSVVARTISDLVDVALQKVEAGAAATPLQPNL
jgi:KaiC/GvpD/RAD55 family RecA-like ATPase